MGLRDYNNDIILMDMVMPMMDGLSAAKLIKSEDNLKNIPIIVLTASITKECEDQFGAYSSGFLRKPFTKSLLYTELIRFLPYRNLHIFKNQIINIEEIEINDLFFKQLFESEYYSIDDYIELIDKETNIINVYNEIISKEEKEIQLKINGKLIKLKNEKLFK